MMISHPEQNCGSCIWWERQGARLAEGERNPASPITVGTCQFHPPAIQYHPEFPLTVFPQTHESRFCGSWEGVEEGGGGDGGEKVIAFPLAHRPAA
jgi:hypothetical protein